MGTITELIKTVLQVIGAITVLCGSVMIIRILLWYNRNVYKYVNKEQNEKSSVTSDDLIN